MHSDGQTLAETYSLILVTGPECLVLLLAGLAKDGSVVFEAPQQGNCIDKSAVMNACAILNSSKSLLC